MEKGTGVRMLVADDFSRGAVELVETVELLASEDGVDGGSWYPQEPGEVQRPSTGAPPLLTGFCHLLGTGCPR
jgi:hypothetical protein